MNLLRATKKNRLLTIVLATSLGIVHMACVADNAFLDTVSLKFLNSYGTPPEHKPKPTSEDEKSFTQKMWEGLRGQRFTAPVLKMTPREVADLAIKASPFNMPYAGKHIDASSTTKLDFFIGSEKQEESLLRRTIGAHTHTYNGMLSLANILAQPVTDRNLLEIRSNIIRELSTNNALRNKYNAAFRKMTHGERSFLSFHLEEDPNATAAQKQIYFNGFARGINRWPMILEGMRVLRSIPLVIAAFPPMLFYPYLKMSEVEGIPALDKPSNTTWKQRLNCGLQGSLSWWMFEPFRGKILAPNHTKNCGYDYAPIENCIEEDNVSVAKKGLKVLNVGMVSFMLWNLYFVSNDVFFKENVIRYLHTKMNDVAVYVRGMQEVCALAAENKHLSKLPGLADLTELAYPTGKLSAEFSHLCGLLDSGTFSGSASFCSLTGRVLTAFDLMKEVHKEFAAAIKAAGEMEAYLAAANLMVSSAKQPVHFCFATFNTNANTPYMKATNFWNPFVSVDKAVTNSIEFGGDTMRGLILTGPNTGGKSTLIKALGINQVLAQTFGIAAADEFEITPFEKMHCHLNIADDTAGGTSLFAAEVSRAQELIESIRNLRSDQFAFVIIDEIFTATSPDQAEKLAYDYIKQMGSYKNCIFIDATHFKKLTTIPEMNNACFNFHMEALTDANGQVTSYTYKLKPGASKVQNAAQVAGEHGIFDGGSLFDGKRA